MSVAAGTFSPLMAMPGMDDSEFERWASLLEKRTGVVVPLKRKAFLVTSVRGRMRETGHADFESYFRELQKIPEGAIEWTTLVDRLTVRENVLFGLGRGRRRARAVGARTRERACDRILELTGVAHLAGAMNKPCWLLLSSAYKDWRWMYDRTDSPWYPSMRLFRQPRPGVWEPVVADAARALVELKAKGRL